MRRQALIDRYLTGSDILRRALEGIPDDLMDARPVPGRWSTRQVVCHLADFEPIYADRMKRVIAEKIPTFFGGDPDTFAAGLAYEHRPIEAEIALIDAVRRQMGAILRELREVDFRRVGRHAEAGQMTLESLLAGIADHVPHHVKFIDEKRTALGI
jgi:uncharacterized damage-inducible protein DinB